MSKDKEKEKQEKIVLPDAEEVARYAPPEAGAAAAPTPPAGAVADGGAVGSMEAQLAECRDKLLRAQAECANIAKRLNQQHAESLRLAGMDLARELLPIMDAFERTLSSIESSKADDAISKGIKLMADQFQKVLRLHGVRPIESLGKPFDPKVHQAIMEDHESDLPPGTITVEMQRGYLMHDRVLRAARVAVAAQPQPESTQEEGQQPAEESTEPPPDGRVS